MVRRTCCCTQTLHLLYEEWEQCALVLDSSLGHWVEVGLVGGSAAFGDHDEAILVALHGLDVNLCGEVAARVDLVVHVERGVLRVAEVVLRIGVIDTEGEGFLVLEACPHLLALLAVDDGCARVLAEGQYALDGGLGIAEELEGDILVVL